jgi:hypothetical protein
MNDEQQLLASAYLDGALTDEERARAEADPEVMAAVDRLGQLRRALAALEPPDRARRDAAINAALGLFDSESQVTAPPPVTSLAARRWTRWLMPAAAAAVVVILAGGILATRDDDGDGGGGDDAAGSATSDGAGAALDVEEDQSADAAPSATGDTRSAPDEGGAAATTNAVTEAAGTLAAAAATTGAPEATAATSVVVLTSPEELTEFASVALFATDYAPPADVARPTCDEVEGQWLGPATYVDDGVETAVEIFLVAAADEVRAVHTATCTVIAIAPAPQR